MEQISLVRASYTDRYGKAVAESFLDALHNTPKE